MQGSLERLGPAKVAQPSTGRRGGRAMESSARIISIYLRQKATSWRAVDKRSVWPASWRPDIDETELGLNVRTEMVSVLEETLDLIALRQTGSELLAAVPEPDSMAVVAIITTPEKRRGCALADYELDGAPFAPVSSLAAFTGSKLGA